jgi:hypothetical protein
MEMFVKLTAVGIVLVVVILGLAVLGTIPMWLVWNHAVVHAIPACQPVTFWQAFGLALFVSMLHPPSVKNTD